jgi:GNAT superfamily N-acetyltransferase
MSERPVTVQQCDPATLSDADLDAIAALITELGYPTDAAAQRDRFAQMIDVGERVPMRLILARRGDNEILGLAIVTALDLALHLGTTAELQALIVGTAHRRMGIGEALVAASCDWASAIGAEMIVLRTANHRADAHTFYETLGFTQITSFRTYRRALLRRNP